VNVTVEQKVALAKEAARLKELVSNLKIQRDDILKKNEELEKIAEGLAEKIKEAAKEAMKQLNIDENLMKEIEEKIDTEAQRIIEALPAKSKDKTENIEAALEAARQVTG
ncbi:6588_t:CDS:1, partial [Scutellospora calospora]